MLMEPPYGKPWALYGLLSVSLTLNLVMVLRPSHEVVSTDIAFEPGAVPAELASVEAPVAPIVEEAAAPAVDVAAQAPGGWSRIDAVVDGSLARTFQVAAGDEADAISAVYARLFMFDLDLRKDIQRGDRVVALYRVDDAGKVEIDAASLTSAKLGRTLTAFHWQAPGDELTRYWDGEGAESGLRLTDGPLADYDQVTSLLKDRPTHQGMDFKVAEGTAVSSPRSGRVERVNWNVGANGDCVEVHYDDGMMAKFLHLSAVKVEAGQRVSVGQTLALTGNTGHSTAPHLHYQLERGGKIVDPIDYHGTWKRKVPENAQADYDTALAHAEDELNGELASR